MTVSDNKPDEAEVREMNEQPEAAGQCHVVH